MDALAPALLLLLLYAQFVGARGHERLLAAALRRDCPALDRRSLLRLLGAMHDVDNKRASRAGRLLVLPAGRGFQGT